MLLPNTARWKMLSPLLDELLGLGEEQQRLRLATLRESDEPLAAELDALLGAACQAEAAYFLGADLGAREASRVSMPGRRVGPYVIEELLGEGASGTVWRARRFDGRFDACVAIKMLHLSLLGRPAAHRFQREGVILARVVHPGIARLLDAGVTEQGQPFLVLELVEGLRIDRHCAQYRCTVRERIGLFLKVLVAVAHAHGQLVIHRDIKPNNVYVLPNGDVKLLDFGIAKLMQEDYASGPMTAEGQRVLTPQYAAPEQLNGGAVEAATDVYALGVLLFQLLTDRHPTAGSSANSMEIMRATLDNDPLSLTAALGPAYAASDEQQAVAATRGTPFASLRRQMAGDLENIVSCALRKEPRDRYRNAVEFAADLQRYLADEPVAARADSLAYRCAKFLRRRRGAAIAGMMFAVALAGGIAATTMQYMRTVALRHELSDVRRALADATARPAAVAPAGMDAAPAAPGLAK